MDSEAEKLRNTMKTSCLGLCVCLMLQMQLHAQDLYAITGAGGVESILYRIDANTGQVIQTIGSLGTTHVTALSFQPTTGDLYGHISNGAVRTDLIKINPQTASFTVVGNTGQQVPDMSFRADGTLFAWSKLNNINANADDAYTLNLSNGSANFLGEAAFPTSQVGLSFAQNGTLYLKNGNSLHTVNPLTGAISSPGLNLTGPTLFNALAFDLQGKAYSINRTGTRSFLETFDLNTGVISQIGEITVGGASINGISAFAFNLTAVPEPSTLALVSVVAVGIGVYGWRRRHYAVRG